MKNKNLFLIICFSLVFFSCAKEKIVHESLESKIKGYLIDMFTLNPIVGATVNLYDGLESPSIKTVVTDENGNFKFNYTAKSGNSKDLYLRFSSDLLSDYQEPSTINGVKETGIFRGGLRLDEGQNYLLEIELTPKE